MRKEEELNNPTSCLNRAADNEMLFVLMGKDLATPETIRFWCKKRIELGKNKVDDEQIINAQKYAFEIEMERDSKND